MRQDRTLHQDVRANALWGRRGESRSNALWGRSGKRMLVLLSLAAMLVVPVAGSAASGGLPGKPSAVVPNSLLAQAAANPDRLFDVIVQGNKDISSSGVGQDVTNSNGKLKMRFLTVNGVDALVSGKSLVQLASNPHVLAITPNVQTKLMGYEDATMWRDTTHLSSPSLTNATSSSLPAIAVVDSGVQARTDFGNRIVASVNMCSLCPLTASGDDNGHGTMVAGIAAGSSPSWPGGAPGAPIVSIRTADATGQSLTSDVIAAADWIDSHARAYNIRVANFSLIGANQTSIAVDPLDRAVERLWLDGIVVVAAAGNHGTGTGPVSMSYAPANDPFVITVGAVDQHQTSSPGDDTIPSWSAYGSTMDGFWKPELSAPGRYMIAPTPMTGTIARTFPDRIVAPGYVWMSGTSFAAPAVAAAAALILSRNLSWTPDQVKGALMVTAVNMPLLPPGAGGVGEINAASAAGKSNPPNPNGGLYPFVSTDPLTGARSFNAASWGTYVGSNASWSTASWGDASWSAVSWNEASWASASWNAASWVANVSLQMSTSASWGESNSAP
jgi:subtilisin family serine protease